MKLIQPWLPSAIAASTLLIVTGPADEVTFSPTKDLSLTRTFEIVNDMALDDMSMMMNGQPFMSPDMEMNMRMSSTISVTDSFEAVSDGRPDVLRRQYDTITSTGAVNVESDMMPDGPVDETIDSASELEGKTVVFTWNADDEAYEASFPDDSGDTDLLEGLEQDMDLTVLLPKGSVSEGDTWDLDVEDLRTLLMPGGDLSLEPNKDDMPEGMPGMDGMSGNLADMLGEIDGTATGEYAGTREVEGVKCAVIQVKVEIQSAADLSDKVGDAMDQLPEGMEMEIGHMDVEMEMDGEGTLLWNLAAGHAHSFEMAATVDSVMDMGMSIDAGGQTMDMEQTMEMSGSFDIKVSVTED